MRKKNGEEKRIEVRKVFRIESLEKDQEDESFRQGKEEDEKRSGGKAFKIDAVLAKLGAEKKKGSRKGIEAEAISREEVHQIP